MTFEQAADIEANTPIIVMAGQCLKWQRERIPALKGALRQICELTEDYEHNQQLSEVWYVANNALTPEGGGK